MFNCCSLNGARECHNYKKVVRVQQKVIGKVLNPPAKLEKLQNQIILFTLNNSHDSNKKN